MMRIHARCRQPPMVDLLEITCPRAGEGAIAAAEGFLGAAALREPFALELAAAGERARFLVRAPAGAACAQLAEQLLAAYPQADAAPLATIGWPSPDPARRGAREQVAACALVLRDPACLPLRAVDERPGRAASADPLLGVLGALLTLPAGWRALAQLLLRPAPEDWGRALLPLALAAPTPRRDAAAEGVSAVELFKPAIFLGLGLAGLQGYLWYADGDWGRLALAGGGTVAAGAGLAALRRLRPRPRPLDPRLVREKLAGGGFLAELRLAVFAPDDGPRGPVERRLAQIAAAYGAYAHAAGNALVPRPVRLDDDDLATLRPRRPAGVLGTRELAGLWHLPLGAAAPGVARTTARRWTPPPEWLREGCPLGESVWQGRTVPVALPDALLRRHLLLVAKTRRGKSSLLLRLAQRVMAGGGALGRRPCLVLIDPHRDLARAAVGLVPPERADDLVYLDVAHTERPFGLNLLDVDLGWGRDRAVEQALDRAVEQALDIFRRQWERYWGPRMESAFRYALQTLLAANATLCAQDAAGRDRQYTILDVSPLLADAVFRRSVLPLVGDPAVAAWWATEFDPLDRRFQLEIVNPVQTKIARYAGSAAARLIVAQPRSTLEPAGWLREGRIVLADTARAVVGEDTAGLLGSTLLNLLAHAVAAQGALPPALRRPVVVIADEFHLNVGADYEGFLGEMAKWGASLVLATQSLARLEALDGAERRRALRALLFANLDGLFAFHCSAEDARYLLPELGSELEIDDLVGLGEHQCYARLSAGGERLPVFSLRLDPPPRPDGPRGEELARASAERWGRPRAAVEADLAAALGRIAAAHAHIVAGEERAGGRPPKEVRESGGGRTAHHQPKTTKHGSGQAALPIEGTAAVAAGAETPEAGEAGEIAAREGS